ncbi:DUF397 domain-containing protein [Streptomyces sp. NBC_00237]|uniref:DUF397 domain-containing protein n=1 Tax=Streptomyces sp. NBC_00237 TaxID=2975687 RepID=UPI002B1DE2CF|nr:DUF397 domain-containing protein [Streptomyces sp. NBC_00237]
MDNSRSGGDQGECLEVARGYGDVPVRASMGVTGPAVRFTAEGWSSFVGAVKGGFAAARRAGPSSGEGPALLGTLVSLGAGPWRWPGAGAADSSS